MVWIVLVAAGLLEIVWALALKASVGFTRPVPSAIAMVGITEGKQRRPVMTEPAQGIELRQFIEIDQHRKDAIAQVVFFGAVPLVHHLPHIDV